MTDFRDTINNNFNQIVVKGLDKRKLVNKDFEDNAITNLP